MPAKKVIAVIGATGAQGGGLVRAIAEDRDGPFAARAITRKPDSDKAREPRRDSRRLHLLRGWGHGTSKQVLARST